MRSRSQQLDGSIRVGDVLTDYSTCKVHVARIAWGGFGQVYMGPDDMNGGEWRALKTLRPALLRSERTRQLFIREACSWVGLWAHRNVLHATTLTRINDDPFLVLVYAEHGSLRDLLAVRQPFATRYGWAQMIAAGLHGLHTPDPAHLRPEPIVHRDLKPENVLVDKYGYAMITDFGLAKVAEGDVAALAASGEREGGPPCSQRYRTRIGEALGTLAYMAPEQWEDAASAGPPADIYAFGLILSELLAGRHGLLDLDRRQSQEVWRQAHKVKQPRPLRQVAPEIPEGVEALYQACLAKSPKGRPSAGQALAALQAGAEALGLAPYVPWSVPHTPKYEVEHWMNWATVYENFRLYDEALARSDRALAIDPGDVDVLNNRGVLLAKMGRIDEALAVYDRALARLPAGDQVRRERNRYNRGLALEKDGRRREAEAMFAEAVALWAEDADAWFDRARNLGCMAEDLAVQGDQPGEVRALAAQRIVCAERALVLNPRHPQIQTLLELLQELGR